MIQITSWNDGFETHDSRKTRGKLSWVRQNILMGEVAWAKLWLRPDAPEIWAGWTALVWVSAQAETRGTTTNAEDVSLVSRIPQVMVEKAIEWALSNGFAQLSGDLPEKLPQHSHNLPDDFPIDSSQSPDVAGNHPDYSTVQDSTGQDEQTNKTKARAKARTVFSEDMFDHLISESLKSEEFLSMWHSWVKCRIGKRKPITSEAAAMQIEMLSKYPTEIAIGCIRTSIANDWQGLFEPKESTPTRHPQPPKPKWTGFTADYYADGPVVQKL